jgi:L-lactate dehydrogenase (cytochrome)
MIISAPTDYREASRRRLPRFLFDYIDGGANGEQTLRRNIDDLSHVTLRQRVLRDVSDIDLKTSLFGQDLSMPIALAPVGLTGMYARRGEVQAAKAAEQAGVGYCLSTVSICSLEEVSAEVDRPIWFQLYVLKDRGFMKSVLERALAQGITTLIFTVDMPVPGSRYRDAHAGMSGPMAPLRRLAQAVTKPQWAFDVGLRGRPHDLGNISAYLGKAIGLEDYMGWIGANFDPSIHWRDIEWVRDFWPGQIILKGILDPEDAKDAVRFGADGLVVSNHGGRQLDGVLSTAHALPAIAKAVSGQITLLADGGVRSGQDVVRMLCLGAQGILLGRAYIYALATHGEAGVSNLLVLIEREMRVTMALTGAKTVSDLGPHMLVQSD